MLPPNVTTAWELFRNCKALTKLSDSFVIPAKITAFNSMFSGC
jgi:hypothetical protein